MYLSNKLRLLIKKLGFRRIEKICNQYDVKMNNNICKPSFDSNQTGEVIIRTCTDPLGTTYCASSILQNKKL